MSTQKFRLYLTETGKQRNVLHMKLNVKMKVPAKIVRVQIPYQIR